MAKVTDNTIVYVWSPKTRRHVSTPANRAKCPECGATYQDMVWDEVIIHEPHLQCPCGEQFSTQNED